MARRKRRQFTDEFKADRREAILESREEEKERRCTSLITWRSQHCIWRILYKFVSFLFHCTLFTSTKNNPVTPYS